LQGVNDAVKAEKGRNFFGPILEEYAIPEESTSRAGKSHFNCSYYYLLPRLPLCRIYFKVAAPTPNPDTEGVGTA
jgi:hypothetical protein